MSTENKELLYIINKSTTIQERVDSNNIHNTDTDEHKKANSRLDRWCEVCAKGKREVFSKRLEWDNLNFSTVEQILCYDYLPTKEYLPLPDWCSIVKKLLQSNILYRREDILNRCLKKEEPIPFEDIYLPWICIAQEQLVLMSGKRYSLLTNEAHSNLERNLLNQLSNICVETFQLEFMLYRSSHKSSLSKLYNNEKNGKDDVYIYNNFKKWMMEGHIQNLMCEYSVLTRLVGTTIDQWIKVTEELLLRLESDWTLIHETFKKNKKQNIEHDIYNEKVIEVKQMSIDYHNYGRTVFCINFSSGIKVIYKPRDLRLESSYYKFLKWYNEYIKTEVLPFKVLKIINKNTYGWVEFVEYLPCRDQLSAIKYIQRSGKLLCVVYIMGGIDFHHENVIAHGEFPVIIDLETLMHPQVQSINGIDIENIQKVIEDSVLQSGLLPKWLAGYKEKSVFDISGFGDSHDKSDVEPVLRLTNINTDNMDYTYDSVILNPCNNIPLLNDIRLSINEYAEEFIKGFQETYHFFLANKKILINPEGPFNEFKHVPIRCVFRPTNIYSSIIEGVLKPKYLTNGCDFNIEIDRLSSNLLSFKTKPLFWPLLKEEQNALFRLDIPYFFIYADCNNLMVSFEDDNLFSNKVIVKEYTRLTSYSKLIRNLQLLSHNDLSRQVSLIRGSLYAYKTREFHRLHIHEENDYSAKTDNASYNTPFDSKVVISHIKDIANEIVRSAVYSNDGSVTWLGIQHLTNTKRQHLAPLGYGLYDGIVGVAIFLASMQKVFKDNTIYRELALKAVQHLNNFLQDKNLKQNINRIGIGGGIGFGSIIYGLAKISQFLEIEIPFLKKFPSSKNLFLEELIHSDQYLDVISGTAGMALGLLAWYEIYPNDQILNLAKVCGEHLLDQRSTNNTGLCFWKSFDGPPMTGFSHGSAGIAYALLRLYQITNRTEFFKVAQEAIDFENSVFDKRSNNWPKYLLSSRKENITNSFCTWCHGASGIGLARIGGLDILDTSVVRNDIRKAISITKKYNFSKLDHLCCGNLGRLEFLLASSEKLSDPMLFNYVLDNTMQTVLRAEQRGYFGLGSNGELFSNNIGFFQGASGIGYELLRMVQPKQLPSILLWE